MTKYLKKYLKTWLLPLTLLCAGLAMQTAGAAESSRLDEVIKSGKLRVCMTGDYKPFTYFKTDNTFEGMDVDLAQSLAKSLGVEVQLVKTTWTNLMTDFLAKCDIAMGGVSVTLDRQKKAAFAVSHMVDGKSPIVRCADVAKFQTLDMIDKPTTRAIFNPGGTNERFAKQFFTHANLSVYPDNVTIFKQILAGKADVMVTDASETLLQQKLNPGLCSVHPDKPFQFGEKAYMVPRGDVAFQQYVDQWLHLALSSGEYQAISDKWLK